MLSFTCINFVGTNYSFACHAFVKQNMVNNIVYRSNYAKAQKVDLLKNDGMLKIGVLGAGHLGKIHIAQLKELSDLYELVGVYDPDPEMEREAIEKFNVHTFSSVDELIDSVEVVDIVTPTLSHFECAEKALRKFRHIFIEKPVTNTMDEARQLMLLTEESGVKAQIGHVERFNPAYLAAKPYFERPMFIESHRLAQFNPRGTDVSVVLDLMIHDIDIIMSCVNSNIKRINASGVAVVSDSPDIASARIEFDNGCVANLTASRISLKNMRKTRFFQRDAYLAVDFLEKKCEVVHLKNAEGNMEQVAAMLEASKEQPSAQLVFDQPVVSPINAIREELRSFANAINNDTNVEVSVVDGYRALEVAHKILDKLKSLHDIF